MNRKKIYFQNKQGERLEGYLELPPNQEAHNYALFAHCFTCTKNLIAIRNISTALTQAGFGVLRFDFTGLGESGGEFSESNLSGNVEDLLEAAAFLEQHAQAPSLLVGHSLGGAAVLFAADQLASVRAVATIGAPAEPTHLKRLLKSGLEEIEKERKAVVDIGGRPFTIKKQFLDDLEKKSLKETVRNARKPLLILHSPQDEIVGIQNAEDLFVAAFHPKSFISLDGADHLMSEEKDSRYVGTVIAAWASRYLDIPEKRSASNQHQVTASLDADDQFTTYLSTRGHQLVADEPRKFGGKDFGPNPYDFLSAALAACSAMTVQMYARHKKWRLENVTVAVGHKKDHAEDCAHCEDAQSKIDRFHKQVSLVGDLSEEQRRRLLEIADRCPVHRTLAGNSHIQSEE